MRLRRWVRDDRGATAIEYAIIAGLISCTILVSVQTLGANLNLVFASLLGQPPAPPKGPGPNAASGGAGL